MGDTPRVTPKGMGCAPLLHSLTRSFARHARSTSPPSAARTTPFGRQVVSWSSPSPKTRNPRRLPGPFSFYLRFRAQPTPRAPSRPRHGPATRADASARALKRQQRYRCRRRWHAQFAADALICRLAFARQPNYCRQVSEHTGKALDRNRRRGINLASPAAHLARRHPLVFRRYRHGSTRLSETGPLLQAETRLSSEERRAPMGRGRRRHYTSRG